MKKLTVLSLYLVFISTCFSLRLNAQDWAEVGTGLGSGTSSGPVRCTAVYNGELYVAGGFTIAGGIVVNHITRWNGSSYSQVGSGIGVGGGNNGQAGEIYSMCVYNGELYVTGDFWSIDGITCPNGIAKWNGTNWSTFLPTCPSLPPLTLVCGLRFGNYNSMTVYNNKLYMAANSTGSGNYNYIHTWDGINLGTISNPLEGGRTLGVYNGDLYSGGANSDGTSIRIAKWNGVNWVQVQGLTSSGPGNQKAINAMQVYNNELYIAGVITSIGGIVITNSIAKWNGSTWSSVGNSSSLGYIYSLCVHNNELYNGAWGSGTADRNLKWNGTSWLNVTQHGVGDGGLICSGSLISYNNNIYGSGSIWSPSLVWLNPSTDVKDIINGGDFNVYPNPSSNTLYLEIPKEFKSNTISIYSSTGELVYKGSYSNQVDISNLSSGVYFLAISTETGILRKGFVVENK